MDSLPTEVLESIMSSLTLQELIRVSQVCCRFREIVTRRHFQNYLVKQEWSITKQLRMRGWSETSDDVGLIIKMFWSVYTHLHTAWLQGSPSSRQKVLGIWVPGDQTSFRVTDTAVYQDKLFLGMENCSVGVYDVNDLSHVTTLETTADTAPALVTHDDNNLPRSCKMVLHNRTLAVNNKSRTKVRLYNVEDNSLVGEIETRAGPIYHISMNDRLLVCLSGWSLLSWRIDSGRPEMVRGRFMGVLPDFEPSDDYQNWLEVHTAVINKDYLVTRATRTLVNTEPNQQARSRIFLHVRRLGPDGFIGAVLRPDSTALDTDIVELNMMKLSENNMLATMVMMRSQSGDFVTGNGQGVYYLRYVINIIDITTGHTVASLPNQSILSSVQIPVCWKQDTLYMKLVPKPVGGFVSDDDDDVYEVSLARWDFTSDTDNLQIIPSVPVSSSSDHINIEASRVVVTSTKFSHRPFPYTLLLNNDDDEAMQDNEQNQGPRFTVSAATYDFWNLIET